jgi:GTP cyclohydrolase III
MDDKKSNKKEYVTPVIEIVEFDCEDVITTSDVNSSYDSYIELPEMPFN